MRRAHFEHETVTGNGRESTAVPPAVVAGTVFLLAAALALSACRGGTPPEAARPEIRSHLDHSAFFDEPFESGEEVTKACLKCHEEEAHELKSTPHWLWLGEKESIPGHEDMGKVRLGKKNVINNFCISIQGNWDACTKCHAGYGWKDADFDFDDVTKMDCLVCHDHSGSYAKDRAGLPRDDSDLLASARSVGYPTRVTCGSCHNYGGGSLAVKHGDLDASLDYPDQADDFHMGALDFHCIDCHGGEDHTILGKSISVSTNAQHGIGCTDCHAEKPHVRDQLNQHTARLACQSCHIPTFANAIPTKMWWDWSKAGDDSREDDVHEYLKIKGEFEYARQVVPEYYWFDGTAGRYMVGDEIQGDGPVKINPPLGKRGSPGSKIWPFKVHRGKQIYDKVNRILLTPLTSGEGGYWHDFDWDQAARLGAEVTGLPYSGDYGFIETEMYWPINHMVQSSEKALGCVECHGAKSRLDWKALGYPADPMKFEVQP